MIVIASVGKGAEAQDITGNDPVSNITSNSERFNSTPKIVQDFTQYYQSKRPPKPFSDIKFQNVLGRAMQISDLKGDWVLVNFWASWCPPCILEMPSLQALQDKYSNYNFKIVAISLDRGMNPKSLRQIMMRHQFGPVAAYYADWPTTKAQVDIPALPTSYILNPDGQMIGKIVAPIDWTSPQVIAFMNELLEVPSED